MRGRRSGSAEAGYDQGPGTRRRARLSSVGATRAPPTVLLLLPQVVILARSAAATPSATEDRMPDASQHAAPRGCPDVRQATDDAAQAQASGAAGADRPGDHDEIRLGTTGVPRGAAIRAAAAAISEIWLVEAPRAEHDLRELLDELARRRLVAVTPRPAP